MKYRLDITGHRFGLLVAIKDVGSDGRSRLWLCQCDCGNTKVVRTDRLRKRAAQSCGCLLKQPRRPLRPDQIAQREKARTLYLSGLSVREVAPLVGLHQAYVYLLCKDIARSRLRPNSANVRTAYSQGRRLLEKKLGRKLQKGERVRYVNGNSLDQSPENVQLEQPLWRNRDYVNAYQREWRKTHASDWRKRHPDQAHALGAASTQRRRARIRTSAGIGVTAEDWAAIKQRYDLTCLRCKRSDRALTMDHVVPVLNGGLHIPSNIQPLCRSCNSVKHTSVIDYRLGAELMAYWYSLVP